jgi:ATP-dependent RNA helicase SUPV3L1/SUV3
VVTNRLGEWTPDHALYRSFGINSQADLEREAKLFIATVSQAINLANGRGSTVRKHNPLFWNLRNAFVRGDTAGLDTEIIYAFQSFILRSKLSNAVVESHKRLADLRFPYEWYPATRSMQRTVHLHVGPTNSGKTYNALKALESAKTGIYAGPLRLLAHEVYSRFKAKDIPCALITGEEQRIPEGTDTYFSSCTVEMAPLNQRVDVAVIDEIQMIADESRGWAWTQAVLGIQARELHLCGEERTVELIQALCARTGDKCEVHRYRRLNPLKAMRTSLGGDFKNLRKGDCVVSFTRVGLHKLKTGIEQATGRRCAIVYGSLPPETRAQQAALFNDPDNDYDFLVASDAIGMGLNLEIRRVIFETAAKFDGMTFRRLSIPEIKQIGGRAGRYRTASREIKDNTASAGSKSRTPSDNEQRSIGLVTVLDGVDLDRIHEAFETEVKPIKAAGIFPPAGIIERFSSFFPANTPLSFVLSRLREMAQLSELFQMCDINVAVEIADIIQDLPMNISDRCVFLSCPVSLRDDGQREVLKAMANCVSTMSKGHILEIEEIDLEVLDLDANDPKLVGGDYLRRLEALHKSITTYLWLSYRYQGVFISQHLAFHIKSLVETKIREYLDTLTFTPDESRRVRRRARKFIAKQREKEALLLSGLDLGTEEPHHEGPGSWNEEGHEEPLMDAKIELVDDELGESITPTELPPQE